MIKAIIIDDESRGILGLKNLLVKYCPDVEILAECRDIVSAFENILIQKPELIFLDIDMPPYTGFDLLKKFESLPFEVIFVTAFDHYAIDAIKFSALDYLLKPLKIQDLKDAIERVKNKIGLQPNFTQKIKDEKGEVKRLVLKSHQGIDLIELDNIIYLKAENVYTKFFLSDGRTILNSKSLKEYEVMLSTKGFFRVHKSYIAQIAQVKHYNNAEGIITMSNNDQISLSINQKEEFLKLL